MLDIGFRRYPARLLQNFQHDPNWTMVGPHDFGADKGMFELGFQAFADEDVIDAPANIVRTCIGAITPP